MTDVEHFHLWTRSIDGAEFGNAIYYDKIEGATVFARLAIGITKGNVPEGHITIEEIMESLGEDRGGMYTGCPGFLMVISKCLGSCNSPTWN